MFCLHCGKEFSDDFTFCPFCGKKVDEKTYCPSCNKEITDGAKYCGFCGTFVGKGEKLSLVKEESPSFDNTSNNGLASKFSFKNVFFHASAISLILGLLFAFIFSFFVGFATNSTETTGGAIMGISETSGSSFYFFKTVYSDVSELLETAIYEGNYVYGAGAYTFAIVCTIFVAMNMVVSLGLLTVACVKYGMAIYYKKSQTFSCFKYFLPALVCFIITACLVGGFLNYSGKVSDSLIKIEGAVSLNGATVTAIILMSIFGLIGLIFNALSKGVKTLKLTNVFGIIVSILAIGVILAILIVITKNYITMKSLPAKGQKSAGSITMSPSTFLFIFGIMFSEFSDGNYYNSFMITSIVSYVFFLFVVVFTVLLLSAIIKSLFDGNSFSNSKIIYGLCAFLSAIGYLVLTIVTKSCLNTLLKNELDYTLGTAPGFDLSLGGPIAIMVLVSVLFIITIVSCFIKFKRKQVEEIE